MNPPIDILEIASRQLFAAKQRVEHAMAMNRGPEAESYLHLSRAFMFTAEEDVRLAQSFAADVAAMRNELFGDVA